MDLGFGNCPVCGKPKGGGKKTGRDHTECSKKLKAEMAGRNERRPEKPLLRYSESRIDYICKRYDK